jgi:hypothetical protein
VCYLQFTFFENPFSKWRKNVNISASQLEKWKGLHASASGRIKRLREQTNEKIENLVTAGETGAAAFAMGAIRGKWGSISVTGVPIDLIGGLGLHALALLGFGGKATEHLHAVGNGVLASYLVIKGYEVGSGQTGVVKALTTPGTRALGAPSVRGDDDGAVGAKLSKQELEALANVPGSV